MTSHANDNTATRLQTIRKLSEMLTVSAGEMIDPNFAADCCWSGHSGAFTCWLIERKVRTLSPTNWKAVVAETWDAAQHEPFMQNFSYDEHSHAVGRFVTEIYTDFHRTKGGLA
jgi:hypothetical protein